MKTSVYQPGRRHFKQGFSLAEILLVVLVLSVVAALSVPVFSGSFQSMRLKNTAEDFAYSMRYAQSRAVLKNRKVRLVFNSNGQGYHLEEQTDKGLQQSHDEFQRISNHLGKEYVWGDFVNIAPQKEFIQFYADGSIDPVTFQVCLAKKKSLSPDHCYTLTTKLKRGSVDVAAGILQDISNEK